MSKRFSGLLEKGKSILSALKPIRPIFVMGIALIAMSVVLVALSSYPTYTFLPSLRYWGETVGVGSETTKTVEIGFLKKNSIFIGKIVVNTTQSPKIVMSLLDSSGLSVFPKFTMQVLVDGNYSFVFQAPKDDFYYFHFDNSFSSAGLSSKYGKTVVWEIFYYGDYSWYFQISGILSLISGLGCIGYQLLSEKRAVHVAGKTYEVLQKRAESQSKTVEEIIEEMVTELEKKG